MNLKKSFRSVELFDEYKKENAFQYGYILYHSLSRLALAILLASHYDNVDIQLFGSGCICVLVS